VNVGGAVGVERVTAWVCASGCTVGALTRGPAPRIPFHRCRELRGLNAPLVPEGTRCRVVAVDRDDYVGDELVQRDGDGRPVMAIRTVRDDGEDCVVLAPSARVSADDVRELRRG